jgi:peptide deformylase
MAVLKIDRVGEFGNVLRKKCAEVSDVSDPEIQNFIVDLMETLVASDTENSKAVGIAAPQVGRAIQIIIVRTNGYEAIMINPKILSRSSMEESGEEGCLSVPGIFKKKKRSKTVEVSYIDPQGFEISAKLKDKIARIFLHEFDHLNGKLFTDK